MDPRVGLLKRFYGSMQPGKVKLETERHGFAYLQAMTEAGAILDYGHLSDSGLIHKYRFTHVPDDLMNELLTEHVDKLCNVCMYFDGHASDVFCFNLDNNHKANNTEVIPEMTFAVDELTRALDALGIEPLVIASGRGFHVWCRLGERVENQRLYDFMIRLTARSMAAMHAHGFDFSKVKFNVYPNVQIIDVVSLRLFGTEHIKNRVFSRVRAKAGLLDEAASWRYFEDYLERKTLPASRFLRAADTLHALFQGA